MTEDEAKKRWCPYASARVVSWQKESNETVNAVWGNPQDIRCIASDCMAWRTKTVRETNRWGDFVDVTTGFCGLAGSLSQ